MAKLGGSLKIYERRPRQREEREEEAPTTIWASGLLCRESKKVGQTNASIDRCNQCLDSSRLLSHSRMIQCDQMVGIKIAQFLPKLPPKSSQNRF